MRFSVAFGHVTVCLAAILVVPNASAQGAQGQASADRYPWDSRPNKCFLPSAPVPAIDFCREPTHWKDYAETVGRVQTLLADPDTDPALLNRAATELALSAQRFNSGEYFFEAWHYATLSQFTGNGEHAAMVVDRWAGAFGASSSAVLARALVYYDEAWTVRGNGQASTVTPEAWALYHRALERADQALDEATDAVKRSGPWHLLKVQIAFNHRGLVAQRLERLDAASRAWPDSTVLYGIAMSRAQPQWGGSFELMDGVARLAAKRATTRSGPATYALIYERVYRGNGWSTMRDSRVDWAMMKAGFRDFETMSDRPVWIWHNFAGLACQMRDQEEARRLYALYDGQNGAARPNPGDACRVFAQGGK